MTKARKNDAPQKARRKDALENAQQRRTLVHARAKVHAHSKARAHAKARTHPKARRYARSYMVCASIVIIRSGLALARRAYFSAPVCAHPSGPALVYLGANASTNASKRGKGAQTRKGLAFASG